MHTVHKKGTSSRKVRHTMRKKITNQYHQWPNSERQLKKDIEKQLGFY
jgi:hypothetical protein